LEGATIIYLDPARRDDHGGRTYGIADCTPNVLELRDTLLAKADYVLLKLSPMLDWRKAVSDLGEDYVCEVHIVSVHNECKELLIVLQKPSDNVLEQKQKTLFCVNDQQLFTVQSPSLLDSSNGVLSPSLQGRLGSLEQPPMWLRPHKGERIPIRDGEQPGVGLHLLTSQVVSVSISPSWPRLFMLLCQPRVQQNLSM
jgi:hypothetical protein